MARERMVTRTIESWNVEAITAFPKAMTMKAAHFYVPGHVKEANFLKYIQETYANEEQIPVSLTGNNYKETQVYGMTESQFMTLAKILDR